LTLGFQALRGKIGMGQAKLERGFFGGQHTTVHKEKLLDLWAGEETYFGTDSYVEESTARRVYFRKDKKRKSSGVKPVFTIIS